ncbi:MAG TPA: AAA family ATPase [Microlunatus sp.]|nr:AAA family ATPase [Microlunatus sp.]
MDASLIGRTVERGELEDAVAAALDGHGGVAMVSGVAGIGKTTLLTAVTAAASEQGVRVLRGRCSLDAGTPALWPWRSVLRQGRRFGLDPRSLDAVEGPPPQARFLSFASTTNDLIRAARRQPLLILLDDLQWADEPSLRLLDHIAREATGTHLLVLGGTRDPSKVSAVVRGADIRWIPLAGWDVASVARFLRESVGPSDRSWPAYVHHLTGGNPLFTREVIHEAKRGWSFNEPPPPELTMPENVRALLHDRLASLSPDVRQVLGAASVLGEDFTLSFLGMVLDLSAGAVAGHVRDAVEAGIVMSTGPQAFRFEHALTRQAAYDACTDAQSAMWHGRAARAVLGSPARADAGRIAGHLVRAAVDALTATQAIDACGVAASRASGRGDHEDAIRWHGRALELAELAQLPVERQAMLLLGLAVSEFAVLRVDSALRHAEASMDLAEILGHADLAAQAALVIRGVGGAAVNQRVGVLCRRALALLPADDLALRGRVIAQQAMAIVETTDDIPDALARRAAAQLALEAAQLSSDADVTATADALHLQERLAAGPDSGSVRIRLGADLAALGRIRERPEAVIWARLWRIDGFLQTGAVAAADAEIAGLAGVADDLGWPLARWQLLRARAARAMLAGRFAEADALAQEGREVAERCGDSSMIGQYYAYRLDVQRKTGRFEPADVSMVAALAESDPRPILLAVAAEYLHAAGDVETAQTLLARLAPQVTELPANIQQPAIAAMAGELAAAFGDRATVQACYRVLEPFAQLYNASSNGYRGAYARPLGVMAMCLDDGPVADAYLTQARAMERSVGARAETALAQLAHAQLCASGHGRHDHDRARQLARAALRLATKLGMNPTRAAATDLLRRLDGLDSAGHSGLTARERQIATLVGDGLTNRQISTQLHVSERTVESHLRNLTLKLGYANRTQVATWVSRAELGDDPP